MSDLNLPDHVGWELDPIEEPVDRIPPERRQEMDREYRAASKGKSRNERQHEWMKYLAIGFKEGGDHLIFLDLRPKPRMFGMRLCKRLVRGEVTKRQFFNKIQTQCADLYTAGLNTYELAVIDVNDRRYLDLTENVIIEGLHSLRGFVPADITDFSRVRTFPVDTTFCRETSKMWHRFIETVHAEYGLPSVADMRGRLREENPSDQFMLRLNNFETAMTQQEKDDLRRQL